MVLMLGHDIGWALPSLRRHAESLMVDACRVDHPGAESFNEVTGQYERTWVAVYDGACRVQLADTMESTPTTSGVEFTVQRIQLQVPVCAETAGVHVGDRVTITASTFEDGLSGRVFTVTADHSKTHSVMRRLACEELAS